MSENDQPPVPPQSPDSEPTDSEPTAVEPTPVAPTEGESTPAEPVAADPEDDVVIAPPVPGEEAAAAAPAKNKNVIIAAAVVAAIVVIGGIFWAITALGGDDDDDDKKDEAKTSSIEDFCKVIKDMDASDDTADDPTIVSDALREAGTPEEMGEDETKGRDLLIKIGDEAKDGPAAEKAVSELDEDETAQVQAFIGYIGATCTPTTPSESPS